MATSGKQPENTSNHPVSTNTETQVHETQPPKNTESNPAKRQYKTSRKESDIWNYFEHNGDKKNPRATCAFCDKSYAADKSRHDTTSLWNHLLHLCPLSPCIEEDPKQKKLSFEPQDGQVSAKLRAVTFNAEDCRKALAKMVMVDEKPFRIVEGEGFRNFIKTLQPMFNVPSRVTTRLNEVSKACDHELKIMAEGMKLKFKKYWENSCNLNLLLYIAVVLDPRYKLKYVKFCLEKMYPADIAYGLMIDVNDAMESLYADYFQHHGKVNSSADGGAAIKDGVSSSLNGGLSSVDVDDENYSKFVKSQFKRHLMEEECIESKSEVAKYLAEPCDNGDEMSFDILAWWKVNASRYPILSLIAKDVLAMSVSTVPSESAFSTGGRILDPFRSSLSPKTVEALVCGQNWLRSLDIHYDFRDEMEDAEKYDITTEEIATGKLSNARSIIRIRD
ncbi:Zinc finger BED domain-containing protein RICESLEEPER 3 [Rhynchospora pubera]|uniref:Zinc finger BED domain-containing protein RICESLEEPER 3 n=1 Tax=Rhynchospora pubera TaxID=906938 RepID=A0AAV8BZZ3_9POAL|nr:Zinc finger BED domain-containing protein RICESLEEPER 3 [Rhynchospora pubera]